MLGTMVHTYNPSFQEAGGPQIGGQPALPSKTLFQNLLWG